MVIAEFPSNAARTSSCKNLTETSKFGYSEADGFEGALSCNDLADTPPVKSILSVTFVSRAVQFLHNFEMIFYTYMYLVQPRIIMNCA